MTRLVLGLVAALVLLSPTARAQAPAPLDAAQRAQIKELMREILKENPEMVLDALQTLETREREESQAKSARALGQLRDQLERDTRDPIGGNPKGDVTLVEFFDYRCPYCKRAAEAMFEAVQADGKVRLVFKELPILGRESVLASRAAMASMIQAPAKYVAFHRALLAEKGSLDEATVLRVAGTVGLDVGRLKTDMGKPEVEAAIKRNLELAQALDIRGTPAFVIGSELIPGAVDAAALQAAIRKARGG